MSLNDEAVGYLQPHKPSLVVPITHHGPSAFSSFHYTSVDPLPRMLSNLLLRFLLFFLQWDSFCRVFLYQLLHVCEFRLYLAIVRCMYIIEWLPLVAVLRSSIPTPLHEYFMSFEEQFSTVCLLFALTNTWAIKSHKTSIRSRFSSHRTFSSFLQFNCSSCGRCVSIYQSLTATQRAHEYCSIIPQTSVFFRTLSAAILFIHSRIGVEIGFFSEKTWSERFVRRKIRKCVHKFQSFWKFALSVFHPMLFCEELDRTCFFECFPK